MSGELPADAGLTAQQEIKRVMKSALDAIIHGLDSRFQQLTGLHEAFGFLLDATSLMTATLTWKVFIRTAELLQMRIQTTSTGTVLWLSLIHI